MKLFQNIGQDIRKNKLLYILALPILAYYIIFCYVPMGGIVMAFQDYSLAGGIFASKWVGFKNFIDFFESYYFVRLLSNTVLLSISDLLVNFPVPIVFALMLNEVMNKRFKKGVQTISYMPYFISTVVICGIIAEFTNSNGVITQIVVMLGGPSGNLLGKPDWFRPIYVGSNMWQRTGYSSIIYLAALASINQELYEASWIDGANRWKQTWYITIPGIMPTVTILFILRMGMLMTVGFEKVLLLYSPATYKTADIISTFTYRKGIEDLNFSFSTAVGLFNSIINTAILLIANMMSRRFSETSLF